MAQTVAQKVEEFNKLPYEERLKIAMNIITVLKEKGNVQAADIYEKMQFIEHPSDKLLEAIYSDFEIGVEKIKAGKREEAAKEFEKSNDVLQRIREMEAAAEAEDGDADDLLADL